jgi:hypothetical protein
MENGVYTDSHLRVRVSRPNALEGDFVFGLVASAALHQDTFLLLGIVGRA